MCLPIPRRPKWNGMVMVVVVLMMMTIVVEEVAAVDMPCVKPKLAECDSYLTTPYQSDDKIVGGDVAEPGSTPWLVSLQDTNYILPVPFCGGTLISHMWVLTSASCVDSYQWDYNSILVVLGEYDMNEIDGWERYRWVNFITLHPNYDYYSHHADVALIRMGFFILYSSRIRPLELPTNEFNNDREFVNDEANLHKIAGWGRVGEGADMSQVVREASVPLLSHQECTTAYPDFTDTMICAGNLIDGGIDSCQGDWGGALATRDGYIRGVSSWSVGCGRPGYPGVYTDVAKVMDWICSVTYREAHIPEHRLQACRNYKKGY